MNRKLLSLLVALVAMFWCLGNMQAQNWTWTGETPSSGNSYYLFADLNDGTNRFLNNTTNSFDAEPNVIWEVSGTFPSSYSLHSAGGYFAIRKPFSTTVETNYNKTGDDVTLASSLNNGKYEIHRSKTFTLGGNRNIKVESSGISTASNATSCWLFISQSQVDLRKKYIDTYNEAKELSETFTGEVPSVLSQTLTTCASASQANANDKIATLQNAMIAAAPKFYVKVIATTDDETMGSVSMTYNGDNAGASTTNNTFVYEGTSPTVPSFEITLKATPDDNFIFEKWTNGTEESKEAQHTITVMGTTEENNTITWRAVFSNVRQGATVAPGKYYIKNVSTGKYMKCASTDLQYDIDVDGEKDLFDLVLDEDNKYYIKNTNNNYVTWGADIDIANIGNYINTLRLNVNNSESSFSMSIPIVGKLEGNYSYKFTETSTGIYNIYYDGSTGKAYLGANGSTLVKDNKSDDIPVEMQWQLIPADVANLKINAGSHGTFCAPYDVTLPEGVEAYKVSEITAESAKLAKLDLTNQVLPAGTPVIVKFTDDKSSINKDYNGLNTTTTKYVNKDHLVGFNTTGYTAPVGSYVLQNQGSGMKFYIVGSQPINMPKNRCYMSTGTTNSAKVLNIIFEEETAVNNIQNTPAAVEYYSINGTKLSAPKSGINIVKTADGSVKKIYVK